MTSLSFQIQPVTGTGASEWEPGTEICEFPRCPRVHDEKQILQGWTNWQLLRHQHDAWTLPPAKQERVEVIRHRMCIVAEQHTPLLGRELQHERVFQA